MVAKILLCVALCCTLTQVSLAWTEESDVSYEQAVLETTEGDATCNEMISQVKEEARVLLLVHYRKVTSELLRASQKGRLCFSGQSVQQCVIDTIKESVENFRQIKVQFENALRELLINVYNTIKTCIRRKSNNLIKNFFQLTLASLN